MSIWSAAASWATSQFIDKFIGGGKDSGGGFWDKAMTAGGELVKSKMFDTSTSNKRYSMRDVDLGVTSAKTYAMSDAKGPDTPEGADYIAAEAKWTRIAKRIAEVQDTSSRV